MDIQALTGGFANPPADASHAFRAALNAMARPGSVEEVVSTDAPIGISTAAAVLLLTLCDHETPLYLAPSHDLPVLRDWIAFHIGAPLVERQTAMFALGTWEDLTPLTDFPIGTAEYPDRSTTVIVETDSISAEGVRLTGPGIKESAFLNLPEPGVFAVNNALYPQGLDFFLTAGTQLAAVPRSTRIEVL